MTTETTGEQKSPADLKLLEDLESILQEYENILLGEPVGDQEYEKYMNLKRSEIDKMSDTDCFFASYQLARHILYIQRKINKESARVKWCNATTNTIASKKWDEFSNCWKTDIRLQMIIRNNDFLEKVNVVKNNAEQRTERLNNIVINLKYMSDTLMEMGKSKRWEKKNNE